MRLGVRSASDQPERQDDPEDQDMCEERQPAGHDALTPAGPVDDQKPSELFTQGGVVRRR